MLCFPGGSEIKNLPANAGDGFDSRIGKIPWSRKWQPSPVFLPVKSHGQRNLVGCSPWGLKESDMTSDRTGMHAKFIWWSTDVEVFRDGSLGGK